jgi:hypothetical protein
MQLIIALFALSLGYTVLGGRLMDYFLVSVLVLFGLISWGLLSRKMWIRSHRSLQRWANENGYTLVSKKVSWTKIPFRKGPYRWASELQIVFRVVVIDEQKKERSGWVRCGSYFKGAAFSDDVIGELDSEH